MKALLIGGTGYLGRSLCVALARSGFDLVIGQHGKVFSHSLNTGARTIPLSLADINSVYQTIEEEQPDVVLHLASTLIPASDAADYVDERHSVIDPTLLLLLHLAKRRLPLVYFSSGGAIYGRTDGNTPNEQSACQPISFYGQSKLEMEQMICFVGRTANLPYLILRPSNPFGGSQPLGGRQGLIAAVLGCVRDRRPLRIWGDGQIVRDYIYIDDLCRAVVHLIVEGAAGIVNVGSGIGHSTLDVVHTVEEIISQPVGLEFAPARAVDVPRIVLDVSRSTALGVPPVRSLADGVRLFASDLGLLHA